MTSAVAVLVGARCGLQVGSTLEVVSWTGIDRKFCDIVETGEEKRPLIADWLGETLADSPGEGCRQPHGPLECAEIDVGVVESHPKPGCIVYVSGLAVGADPHAPGPFSVLRPCGGLAQRSGSPPTCSRVPATWLR